MKEQIEVKGMVIAQTPIGEYDRRVVLLTLEKGKISAFAKGARRQNSKLIGACQPMTFGVFTLYAGKNSYTVLAAEIEYYFPEVKNDLVKIAYGSYFLEVASCLTRENNDEREILKLLYQTLRTLEKGRIPYKLIRSIYEIRVITCFGEGISPFLCDECQNQENLEYYSFSREGCLCSECKNRSVDKIRLVSSALYTLQYIVSSPIERLYRFLVSDEVQEQIQKISSSLLKKYIREELKSLEMLELLQ